MTIELGTGELTLAQLATIQRGGARLSVPAAARQRMTQSLRLVEAVAAGDTPVYGINTGFGRLAQTRIAAADLRTLQRNIILSHCAGVGAPLDDAVARLTLALKAASLAAGASGVRPEIVDALIALYHAGVLPVIPAQGSVGASGDLAPLAHLGAVLLGMGEVRLRGRTRPARDGLAAAGLAPIELQAKEGLALINGTQVSTALALAGLFAIERAFRAADRTDLILRQD